MTRKSQKDEEKEHLLQALKLLELNYKIEREGESPDFILQLHGNSIGVEITELYRQKDAKVEKYIRDVTRKALDIFKEKGGPSLIFAFGVDGTAPINREKGVSKKLAGSLLSYCYDEQNKEITLPHKVALNNNHFKDIQKYLPMIRHICIDVSYINKPESFVISEFNTIEADIKDIKSIIYSKSLKAEKYHCDFSEKWLIIVLPYMAMSGDLCIPANSSVDIEHKFDAVYLLDSYRNRICKIQAH